MMAIVFGAPMPFKKATVAVAYAPDPAQIRKVHGEPVSITLSAVAVGMSRGTCFWVTAGTRELGVFLGEAPRMDCDLAQCKRLETPFAGLSGLVFSAVSSTTTVFLRQLPLLFCSSTG